MTPGRNLSYCSWRNQRTASHEQFRHKASLGKGQPVDQDASHRKAVTCQFRSCLGVRLDQRIEEESSIQFEFSIFKRALIGQECIHLRGSGQDLVQLIG